MAGLPIVCTLSPEALRARREGLLSNLVRRAEDRVEADGGPIVLELGGPPGTREFVTALLEA